MSQHDYNIANQGFPGARTDLNNALSAIATNNAGASEPSTTFAYQWWYDSTANIHKMRNAANDAWINMAVFDQATNSWRLPAAALSEVDGNIVPDGNGTRALGSAAAAWSGVFTREINSGPLAGFRNAIINGGFDIWQRGTSFSNPASGSYLADRWYHNFDGTGSTRSITREAWGVGASGLGSNPLYRLRYQQSVAGSGATFTQLVQAIENVETFQGQTVSIRIAMFGGSALTLPSISLFQNFGTGGSPSAGVSTTVASNVAITSGGTVYTFSVSVPSISGKTLGTNRNDHLSLVIQLPINTTFDFYISEVQVERGPVATPFERRPIATELALCQRYLPAFNWSGGNDLVGHGHSFDTDKSFIHIPFPVTPRSSPTGISVTNAGNFTLRNGSNVGGAPTSIVFAMGSSLAMGQVQVNTTAGSPTIAAGDGAWLFANAAAQILFTGCEL